MSFCTAVNYAALGLGEDGKPAYSDQDKCIECGICYRICSARHDLEEETKQQVAWSAPLGRVMDTSVACAMDPIVRDKGTDGGAVTSLLLHLLDSGHIDGAVVSKRVGLFQHHPWVATSPEELVEAAGSYFDASQGMAHLGKNYSTFSPSVQAFKPLLKKGLRRVAFVGVPCQIKTVRKMETLGIVPTDSIHLLVGLFCSGNFNFGNAQRERLEEMGGFKWDDVVKVNLKGKMLLTLSSGKVVSFGLDEIDFMKRQACKHCSDYAAEFADISFGGMGAPENWTTAIMRTPKGRAAFADAKWKTLQEFPLEDNPKFASDALHKVLEYSDRKKELAEAEIAKL